MGEENKERDARAGKAGGRVGIFVNKLVSSGLLSLRGAAKCETRPLRAART